MSRTQIDHVIWSYRPAQAEPGVLRLDEHDINHLVRIHHRYNVRPESVSDVRLEFIGDREDLLRYVLKECDVLLRTDGHLDILATQVELHGLAVRSINQIMYEVSVSTNGRYLLESKSVEGEIARLRYRKTRPVLAVDDEISKWSFGIISDGRNVPNVQRLVESIAAQGIPDYEILICGPEKIGAAVQHPNARMLPDVVYGGDIRGPICAKKNQIMRASRYNNLCVMHDHFALPAMWYERMCRYGNFFDFLNVRNQSANGKRVIEGAEFRARPGDVYGRRGGALPLGKWSKDYFPGGGVIIAKKSLVDGFLLDERLHWGEMEDAQWAQMAYLNGLFCYFDPDNYIVTYSLRHVELDESASLWRKTREKLQWVVETARQRTLHRRNVARYSSPTGS